jgi:hypothetical protein
MSRFNDTRVLGDRGPGGYYRKFSAGLPMAVIQVATIDSETGAEVPRSRLRTGSAQAAVDHACQLNATHLPPRYAARILYWGEFVDPAFAELSQLAQQRGIEVEIGGA